MKNLGCNYSSPIHKSSCDRRDTDCIKASLIGAPLVSDRAIYISCLTKASGGVKDKHEKHLVCIDPRVENYQHLASGVKPGTEIIVLDPTLDGVEQITEILAKRSLIASFLLILHCQLDCWKPLYLRLLILSASARKQFPIFQSQPCTLIIKYRLFP